MKYKKLTAVPKTAEEITGVEGCSSFSFFFEDETFDLIYTSEMNELALEKKRIEVEPLENMIDKYYEKYDYKNIIIDPEDNQYFWKKEWLKDIREDVDWLKISVDTKVIVSEHKDFKNCSKQNFAKYENGVIYCFEAGRNSWSDDGKNDLVSWPYAKLAEEENDES